MGSRCRIPRVHRICAGRPRRFWHTDPTMPRTVPPPPRGQSTSSVRPLCAVRRPPTYAGRVRAPVGPAPVPVPTGSGPADRPPSQIVSERTRRSVSQTAAVEPVMDLVAGWRWTDSVPEPLWPARNRRWPPRPRRSRRPAARRPSGPAHRPRRTDTVGGREVARVQQQHGRIVVDVAEHDRGPLRGPILRGADARLWGDTRTLCDRRGNRGRGLPPRLGVRVQDRDRGCPWSTSVVSIRRG